MCQYLIEKILNIKIADISYPDVEKTIDIRLDSKSVRLDVYVKDDTGRVFDIEMQCENEPNGGLTKRTRYYQAMIDAERENQRSLEEERTRLNDDLNNKLKTGQVTYGTDAYDNMVSQINDVTNAINESKLSAQEFENAIQEDRRLKQVTVGYRKRTVFFQKCAYWCFGLSLLSLLIYSFLREFPEVLI